MNLETKVGLFMLAGITVLTIGIFSLGDITFRRQYRIDIVFRSVEGLPDNAAVKVSGVEVGKVAGIVLEHQQAKVTVHLNRDIKMHEGASASILSTGLIGTKFVALTTGDSDRPMLAPGSIIHGKDALLYEEIFARAMEGIDELKQTLQEVRGEGEFGKNLNEAMARINRIAQRLDEITKQHRADIETTLANFKEISEKLNTTVDYIESIAMKIDKGEGIAGKLVNDEEMGKSLKETMDSLKTVSGDAKKFFNKLTGIRTYWDYRLRYDVEQEEYKSDLGIKLCPREGKYYFFGINNAGDGKHEDADGEQMNTFTAELGMDFGPFTVHGGVIRSSGGFGLKIRPFKLLELTGEAYNFSREKEDEFSHGYDTPVYNAGGMIHLTEWLRVGGQAEDIKGDKNFNAYMNLVFEDQDLAYLLGFVGLAK